MYELTSHTVTEPMLREIRHRALPSLQRRREHDRALRLLADMPSSGVPRAAAVPAGGRWSLAGLASALRRRRGLAVDVS